MKGDYTVRSLQEEDRDLALALMRESLGEGPMGRSPKVWHWKHRSSPFGASPGLLAEADGELVGLRLFLPWQWTAGGQTVRAVRAVDTATRSDWRGRGIFRRLTLDLAEQMQQEGTSFIFNTPNSKSRPGYLKMDWLSVSRLRLRARPTRRLFRLNRSATSEGMAVLPGGPVEDLLAQGHLPRLLERFRAADTTRWATPRTPEYLRWRYADAPRLGYRALWQFTSDGASGAAIIARCRRRGGLSEASLAEILLTPDDAGFRAARGLIHEIAGCGVDLLLATAAPRTPEQRVTRDFLPVIVPSRHFTLRPLGALPTPDPRRWSAWRLSLGDLEVF